jgi:hypothetical protein
MLVETDRIYQLLASMRLQKSVASTLASECFVVSGRNAKITSENLRRVVGVNLNG